MLSYTSMRELPVGIMAIVLSLVPIMTSRWVLLPGMDRGRAAPPLGLFCGTPAVLLLTPPRASMPEPEDSVRTSCRCRSTSPTRSNACISAAVGAPLGVLQAPCA